MTESEWKACAEPFAMLEAVGDRLGARKLRLFAVACCRRVARLLTPEARAALEVAEDFAEGKATAAERKAARAEAFGAGWVGPPEFPREQVMHARGHAKDAVCSALSRKASEAALRAAGASFRAAVQFAWNSSRQAYTAEGVPTPQVILRWQEGLATARAAEQKAQADLLRCVAGNPFRPVALDPAWLAGNDGAGRRLAESIYEERASDRLPILADALEDAGCTSPEVLAHCRGPGPHVCGCWVVDLLLGKG
jgi:hypothetical protein